MNAEHPERNPSAWRRECLKILQGIHPEYRSNREVSGRFIEFIRPGPGGLLVSQNFIHIRGDYYLCFALLFTTHLSRQLFHPLFAGSRFDHGRTIWRQFLDDVGVSRGDPGCPSGLWSFGPWRSNTLENLARGLALNEKHLLPFYHQALRNGKHRLISLFEVARRIIPALDPTLPVAPQAPRFGAETRALETFPLAAAQLTALTIARGGQCYVGFGPKTNTVDLASIPPELMILYFADVFQAERDRLDEILAIASAL